MHTYLTYNIILVSSVQHVTRYTTQNYNIIDYIPCAVYDIPVTYLFYIW